MNSTKPHPQAVNAELFLDCPFCGRAPKLSNRASNVTESGWVYFAYCHCGGYAACAHQMGDTPDKLLEKWNTRPGEFAALQRVIELEKQCVVWW